MDRHVPVEVEGLPLGFTIRVCHEGLPLGFAFMFEDWPQRGA